MLKLVTLAAAASALIVPHARLRGPPQRFRTTRDVALQSSNDGGVGASIDEAAAKMASAAAVAKATLPANRRALALWRVGWFSWWCQFVLSVISGVVLAFARLSAPRASTLGSLADGFFFAAAGAAAALTSVAWTWRITRLARVEMTVDSRAQVLRKTQGALRAGAKLNLAGMALTLLSAEQVVGALIAKALTAPGAVTGLLQPNALSPAVQAFTSIDMFVVQANTNTLCAHFVGLVCSLGLLARSDKW